MHSGGTWVRGAVSGGEAVDKGSELQAMVKQRSESYEGEGHREARMVRGKRVLCRWWVGRLRLGQDSVVCGGWLA